MASHLNVVSEHDLEWGEQSHAEVRSPPQETRFGRRWEEAGVQPL